MKTQQSEAHVYDSIDTTAILTEYYALIDQGKEEEARLVLKKVPVPSYLSATSKAIFGADYYAENGFTIEKQ